VTRKRPALFRGRHFEDVIILLCVRWYLRIEQDHRFIKKRITASLGFRSVEGACRTIAGY
jgi:transposase-like protein